MKRNDSNISLDNNLESTFIEVNLPKKSLGGFTKTYKHPNMPIADFNSKYLTPLLEKQKKNFVFRWVTLALI